MGRIVTIPEYLNWNVNEVSIGDVVDMGNRQFEFSRVDIIDIRNVLQESSFDVVTLCNSGNINPFSLFRPKIFNIEGAGPRDMTLFAGYNPNALPPVYVFPRTGNSKTKGYNGTNAIIPVQFTLAIGERYPLHSGSNSSWSEIAVKVVLGGVTQWATLALPSSNYVNLSFTTPNTGAETVTAQISAYYVDYAGGITLSGYKDGHYKGLLIEDGEISFPIACSGVPRSYYCDFSYGIGWNTTKKWVDVNSLDPTGYVYSFSGWYASLGSINQDFGSYAEVGLVTDAGVPNCGTFNVTVTATYGSMIPVSQLVTIRIRNNIVQINPD